MQLKIGDKVRFLNEVGSGIVLKINTKYATIEDENGFTMEYPVSMLVCQMTIPSNDLISKLPPNAKESSPNCQAKVSKVVSKTQDWLIDLHMESLVDSHKHMSNHEIVLFQLSKFKLFLSKSEEARARKIIVVHGVGSGKLKQEIKLIVQGIKGAEMFDADYSKFGGGASVILRKYNIR